MSDKKLVSRWDWIWLVVVGVIILFIVLAKFDIHFAYHAESTEIADNEGERKRIRTPRKGDYVEMGSDFDLEQIAESFAEDNTEDLDYYGLERKEIAFFNRIKEQYEGNRRIKDADDWLSVLRRVRRTYNEVKAVFEESDRPPSKPNDEVFANLESTFGISSEKCKQYAQRVGGDLLDWTFFVNRER